jgi:uncharacterized protein
MPTYFGTEIFFIRMVYVDFSIYVRKLSPKWLIPLALFAIIIPSLFNLGMSVAIPHMPEEALTELNETFHPSTEDIEDELSKYRGSFSQQFEHRIPASLQVQTFVFLIFLGWRAGGMMLLGMALFKMGILTASKSTRFYLYFAGINFLIGLPIIIYGVYWNFQINWSLLSFFGGSQFNYWGSIFVSFGYIGVLCTITKLGIGKKVTDLLANVGRMALSNYFFHTFACTVIFYGNGLGWIGYLERIQQLGVVILIWVIQIILSAVWIHYFKFGPFEWLWRSMTYWKLQPIMK